MEVTKREVYLFPKPGAGNTDIRMLGWRQTSNGVTRVRGPLGWSSPVEKCDLVTP